VRGGTKRWTFTKSLERSQKTNKTNKSTSIEIEISIQLYTEHFYVNIINILNRRSNPSI
jgi:hypothetical protein